jgi:acetyl esterase/lipase
VAKLSKKRVLIAVLAAVVTAFVLVVFLNRHMTRFRLAYGPGEVTVVRDIVYVPSSTNPKHRLDVYAPKDAHGAPVVHFIHGGYWVEGDKDHYALISGLYGSIGMALAKKGIVTIVQSYRLSPEVSIDAIVDDVMAGLKWTETHAGEHGGDAHRVFVMGHSAGGHLTAILGTRDDLHTSHGMDPRAVSGYIALSAVLDIKGMHDEHGAEWNAKVTQPVFGEDARWPDWSPLAHLGASTPPFFIIVGEHDFPFMIPQAQKARDKLTGLGAKPRYLMVPGNNHAAMVLELGTKDDRISPAVFEFVSEKR